MYLSNKKHILSNTLIVVTLIQFISTVVQIIFRYNMRLDTKGPDMLNVSIFTMQHIVTGFSIFLSLIVFALAMKKTKTYINMVDADDRAMMGRLQEDQLGEGLSALPAGTIYKLLELWSIILVGVGIIQVVSSTLYRRFIVKLYDFGSADQTISNKQLSEIYNQTQGFKYLTMVCALLLGIIITAVMLDNRLFKALAVLAALVFMVMFCAFNINHISLFGKNIGIVWTSVFFHLLSTVGVIAFAIYLRIRYKGV